MGPRKAALGPWVTPARDTLAKRAGPRGVCDIRNTSAPSGEEGSVNASELKDRHI